MKNDNIRIALIGCGNMGNYYAHNINKMDGVQIVACCDPSSPKLEDFQDKWNIPAGYTDWHNLFRESGTRSIDAVIGCTVDSLRGEIFRACLSSGIPLFTEKPFAVPFELLNTYSFSELSNHIFGINFSKRCLSPVSAAQQFIANGGLGKLHRIELHYRQGWVLNHDYGDWHDTSPWFWRLTEDLSHHGILGDLGSHLFDLACFFAGPLSSISCRLNSFPKEPETLRGHELNSPDDALCLMETKEGMPVLINASRTAAGEKDSLKIMICGKKGTIEIAVEEMKNSYKLFLPEIGEWQVVPCPGRPCRNHEYFISLLKGHENGGCPGINEAIRNHVIIEAAVESDKQKKRIRIDEFGKERLGEIWENMIY